MQFNHIGKHLDDQSLYVSYKPEDRLKKFIDIFFWTVLVVAAVSFALSLVWPFLVR